MVRAKMLSEQLFSQVVDLFKKATKSPWNAPDLAEMRETIEEFGKFALRGGKPEAWTVRLVFEQRELGMEVFAEPNPDLPEAALPQAKRFSQEFNTILETLLK